MFEDASNRVQFKADTNKAIKEAIRRKQAPLRLKNHNAYLEDKAEISDSEGTLRTANYVG